MKNINSVIPNVSKSLTQTIKPPARSVSSGGGVTPSSSTAISKAKGAGSNPNYLPKIANMPYGPLEDEGTYGQRDMSDFFQKTIKDLEAMKNADSIKALAKGLGAAGIIMATTGAVGQNPLLKRIGIGMGGVGGLTHGISGAVKKKIERDMNERNKAITQGFQKRAVAVSAPIHSVMAALGMANPLTTAAIVGADILTLPWLANVGKKQFFQGLSSGLKKQLGYTMENKGLVSEKTKSGLVDLVRGFSESFVNKAENIGGRFFGEKGGRFAKGTADYLAQVPKAAVGAGGYEWAEKVAPVFNVTQQIDPLMTQRAVTALGAGADAEAARKVLKEIGNRYQNNFKDILKAFNETDHLKKLFSSKPGSKEQFMADLKAFYEGTLSVDKFDSTTRNIIAGIKDTDKAMGTLDKVVERRKGLIDFVGNVLGKPSGGIVDAIKENRLADLAEGIDKADLAIQRGLAAAGATTALGIGSQVAGSVATNQLDKMEQKKKTRELMRQSLRSSYEAS